MGYHSRFNPECNTERRFIDSLYSVYSTEAYMLLPSKIIWTHCACHWHSHRQQWADSLIPYNCSLRRFCLTLIWHNLLTPQPRINNFIILQRNIPKTFVYLSKNTTKDCTTARFLLAFKIVLLISLDFRIQQKFLIWVYSSL